VVLSITTQTTAPFVPILHQWLVEDSGLLPGDSLVQDKVQHLMQVNQSPLPAGTSTAPLAATQIESMPTSVNTAVPITLLGTAQIRVCPNQG